MTKDLGARLIRHNRGYERTTKPYKTFKLIYKEIYNNGAEAREREKYLKSGIGREFIRNFI